MDVLAVRSADCGGAAAAPLAGPEPILRVG